MRVSVYVAIRFRANIFYRTIVITDVYKSDVLGRMCSMIMGFPGHCSYPKTPQHFTNFILKFEQVHFTTHRYALNSYIPASILYKSTAGRYQPIRVADGPITTRYRFM